MTREDLHDGGVDGHEAEGAAPVDGDAAAGEVVAGDPDVRELDDADTGPIVSLDSMLSDVDVDVDARDTVDAETVAADTSAVGASAVDTSAVDSAERDAFELELDRERGGAGPLTDVPLYDHTTDGDPLGPPITPSPGSHRHRESAVGSESADAAREGWRRALPVALIAVGAVVVGIAVADLWPSGNTSTPTASAPVTQPTSSTVALPGVLAGSAVPARGAASTGTVPPSAAVSSKPAAGTASVTVLNQTAVKDLGATEGARITAAGWYVRRITDVNARETVTTVFYDIGQEDQAQQLIRTVPTVHRAQPRPLWLLRTGGLIVVVADDAA